MVLNLKGAPHYVAHKVGGIMVYLKHAMHGSRLITLSFGDMLRPTKPMTICVSELAGCVLCQMLSKLPCSIYAAWEYARETSGWSPGPRRRYATANAAEPRGSTSVSPADFQAWSRFWVVTYVYV
jgi:hypothetical protein